MRPISGSMDIIDPIGLQHLRPDIQAIPVDWGKSRQIQLDMLRLDRIDPHISGNKWFKLVYNLEAAKKEGYNTVLSFGGPWSNHLAAFAIAAQMIGIKAVGVVRGAHFEQAPTPTLIHCKNAGMSLQFVAREQYTLKDNADWLDQLQVQWDHPYIIPEGGANKEGRRGAGLIANFIPNTYTHICVSVGSGTTLAGLRQSLSLNQYVLGFAPMKQGRYLMDVVGNWLDANQNTRWSITDEYHFGGFGKVNADLTHWMEQFFQQTGIQLDRVYTGKMMYGVMDLIRNGYFPEAASILCIHTGGLQGNG